MCLLVARLQSNRHGRALGDDFSSDREVVASQSFVELFQIFPLQRCPLRVGERWVVGLIFFE